MTQSLENILFLDIETTGAAASYSDLDENMQRHWDKKMQWASQTEEQSPEALYARAGIYAEFGKVICISVAYLKNEVLRIKSFFGDDEKQLLEDFADLLNHHFSKSHHRLCAHNGKEFDFPYLCRRMLLQNIPLPFILDIAGKKPWETTFLDTMEMWKFGDYKHYISLDLLSTLFHIPSPKDDIDGSQVHDIYWQTKDIDRIVTYCEKDVLAVVQLFLRYQGKELLSEHQIITV
ncbi:MAG: 3'-5' exonuclease [Bacteroidales bacterium]|jgi:uncharacterized protein YprB with RNaseH-like and TPR domain|nr:3'-5' exonuclease [Bacteroidales bacterium]